MFEVYGRHAPMFVLSEAKKFSELFTGVLAFRDAELRESGVEILPLAQTVRIAEINQFIVKSGLGVERVRALIEESAGFQRLRDARQNASQLIEQVAASMVEQLGVDSSLCIGASLLKAMRLPPAATRNSAKPLVIFNALEKMPRQLFENPEWRGLDHPALWIGRDWLPAMEGVEAFFAISPEFKLEVALNRYQPLSCFGDFSVGMVRF